MLQTTTNPQIETKIISVLSNWILYIFYITSFPHYSSHQGHPNDPIDYQEHHLQVGGRFVGLHGIGQDLLQRVPHFLRAFDLNLAPAQSALYLFDQLLHVQELRRLHQRRVDHFHHHRRVEALDDLQLEQRVVLLDVEVLQTLHADPVLARELVLGGRVLEDEGLSRVHFRAVEGPFVELDVLL